MRPTIALLAALAFSARTDAALIQMTEPVDQENYLEVQIEVTTFSFPRVFQIRDSENDDFEDWTSVIYSDVPNRIIQPFWVPVEDAKFDHRPDNVQLEYTEILVQEFITAGDAGVTMFLDPQEHAELPWHVVTFDSPNLGEVTRTFERFNVLPEPSSACLIALCGLTYRRRR